MRVSAKGEYAIRALLDLALHEGETLSPIQDIAARQRIPLVGSRDQSRRMQPLRT